MRTLAQRWKKAAYGKPKQFKGSGKLINLGADVGTRIVQYVYFRPESFGYRVGKGKK
jgi:hypothetical protein